MNILTEIQVRGYHADFYGHVNNARYLEFFEEDRWAQLESKFNLQKMAAKGLVFLVVNINIDYRTAVPVGTVLQITTQLAKVGKRSAALRQEAVIKETQASAAEAIVTFVIGDKSGHAVEMKDDLLEELLKLERVSDFELPC